ncbi:550_t:CDS:2 [Funneliformis geosporum]|uniref:10685_t:CDS:1 n=1 Tax=Funneliformis geosporum TaxID=1117311 RepID=A0A9W4T1X8_9GLOM|nr:10685_t:CDS:2 [Funneliformis geosporum]CAI2191356.1 550_t:CDS:2 [Funneliformis geosporum]
MTRNKKTLRKPVKMGASLGNNGVGSAQFTNAEDMKNRFFNNAANRRKAGDKAHDCEALATFFNSFADIDSLKREMTLAVSEQEFNTRKSRFQQKLQTDLSNIQSITPVHQQEIIQLEAEIKAVEAKYQENFAKANKETDPVKKANFVALANEALDEVKRLKNKYSQNPIANLGKFDYSND